MKIKKCSKCGREYSMNEEFCSFCGLKSLVACEKDGESVTAIPMTERNSETLCGLERGIGINTSFYSFCIWIFVISVTFLFGYFGYKITDSVGFCLLCCIIGFFSGLFSTLIVRLLMVIAKNTQIIANNMCNDSRDKKQ